jgi:phospholipid/cholesterol/gamma-HCH transport system substrate-binding protein
MDKKRLELKVGIFALIGLVLIAVLMLKFSKSMTGFRGTYELRMRAGNIGGLKTRAAVLMSGYPIGTVNGINLAPDGKSVTIFLKIYNEYAIHADAQFMIQQSGFLGDQFVAIVPTENAGPALTNNAIVECENPFDLQEAARAASGLIRRVDDTAKKLNDAVIDVRRLLLNEKTLTNLAFTVTTMRSASERALYTINEMSAIFSTNGPIVSQSMSNLNLSTEEINHFAASLNDVLATNSQAIAVAVKNITDSTATLKSMMDDVNAGKGPAGVILRDPQIAADLSQITANLAITTSNLNRVGLWGILWSKKAPKHTEPHPLESPKNADH